MTIRLLLLDGRPIRSARISALLRDTAGIDTVGRLASAEQAQRHCLATPPDCIAVAPEEMITAEFESLRGLLRARNIRILAYPDSTDTRLVPAAAIGPSGSAAAPSQAAIIADALAAAALALPRAASGAAASGAAAPGDILPDPGRPRESRPRMRPPLVCIGASTGGLSVLQQILETFPENAPPTLIVQHIRGDFASGVADRLDRACRVSVAEAFPGAPIRPGRAYLAPGDRMHLEIRGSVDPLCKLTPGAKVSGHRPSVDALFLSAARVAAPAVIGVLLTGMGRDGAEGLLAIRNRGGRTIAQDSATSTVFGMPRAAVELGAAERVLPGHKIGEAILELCGEFRGTQREPAP